MRFQRMQQPTPMTIKSMLHRLSGMKAENVFLCFSIFFGFLFVFLIPPFQSLDEQSHYLRVFQIKSGQLIGSHTKPVGAGGILPLNVGESTYDMLAARKNGEVPTKYNHNKILKYAHDRPDASKKGQYIFPNTVLYSPVPYMGHLVGLFLADNILGAGLSPMVYMTRISGLLFWVFLMYWAIRTIPFGRWALMSIALIPAALYEASTINADAMTMAVAAFIIAKALSLRFRDKLISKHEIALLSGIVITLGLLKPAYSIVALSLFLVVRSKRAIKEYILPSMLVFIALATSLL